MSNVACVCDQADEYVVYCTDQQRLRYLVEFTVPTDVPIPRSATASLLPQSINIHSAQSDTHLPPGLVYQMSQDIVGILTTSVIELSLN